MPSRAASALLGKQSCAFLADAIAGLWLAEGGSMVRGIWPCLSFFFFLLLIFAFFFLCFCFLGSSGWISEDVANQRQWVLPLFWAGLAGAGRGLVWFGSRGLGLTDWVGSGT